MPAVSPERSHEERERQAFGARILELAEEVGSGRQLAAIAGVSPPAVRKWMLGETDPTRGNLVALATALDVELLWLVSGAGPKRRPREAPMPNADSTAPFLPPVFEGTDDLEQPLPEPVRVEAARRWKVGTIHLRVPTEVKELAPHIVPNDLIFGIWSGYDAKLHRVILDGDGLFVLSLPPEKHPQREKEVALAKKLVKDPTTLQQLLEGIAVRYLTARESRGVITRAFSGGVKEFDLPLEVAERWVRGRILSVVRPTGVRPVVSKAG